MDKRPDSQWHPTTIKRDGKDFAVELPPIWQRRYDPDTTDEMEARHIDCLLEWDDFDYRPDIYHGHELTLINETETMELYLVLDRESPFIPEEIKSVAGTPDRPCKALVSFDGKKLPADIKIRRTSTDVADTIRARRMSAQEVSIAPVSGIHGKEIKVREYGVLTVHGDFDAIYYQDVRYTFSRTTKGKALLRFLCKEKGAIGKDHAVTKKQITAYFIRVGISVPSDWRPAHSFRRKNQPLYAAIGCSDTDGKYWVNDKLPTNI